MGFFDRFSLVKVQNELLELRKQRIEEIERQLHESHLLYLNNMRVTLALSIAFRRSLDEEDMETITRRLDAAIVDWADMVARLEEEIV